MSDFEEHKVGWYEAQAVEEIEDFDKDQYGNTWFNVKFLGNAETFMWLAKNTPEEGKKYYGHLEPTKSGKRLRFKTDKVPEDEERPQGAHKPQKSTETEEAIARAVALKAAVEYGIASTDKQSDTTPNEILVMADTFLAWLKNEKPPEEVKKEVKKKVDEVFNTDTMPEDFLQGDE